MKKLVFLAVLLLTGTAGMAQSKVSGTIIDDLTGAPLPGANVIIVGTITGTATDFDGNYELTSDAQPPYQIEISYTGYASQIVTVNSTDEVVNLSLVEQAFRGEEVIVSASRRQEKVQEAPASVSVLTTRKLDATPNATDVARNLINVPGIQIQQQSANRINISARGGSGLFGTSIFPILDYRSLIAPGVGSLQTDQAGLNQLDIERIEVVRGAGSALYGPGVTQGVIHFITKSPIDRPGTSIELIGGELNTWGGSFRHGSKVNDKFGWKVAGQYRRGDEFTLDPNNTEDAAQISLFQNSVIRPDITPEGFVDQFSPGTVLIDNLDEDGDGNPMADSWWNMAFNGALEFRPSDNTTLNFAAGVNAGSSVFYNEQGEGLAQATEFWGQARAQIGGLFLQAFYVDNNGGSDDNPTFLYQTGNQTNIARQQVEGQAQYSFDTPDFLNANWIAGVDYRYAGQDTGGLTYGRNEDDDNFSVLGTYVQGKFVLSEKLDFVAAARYDQFNFIDEGGWSPRAALVYKASPKHTFRGSYNRTTSTVSNLQLNIDFPLAEVIPGAFDVWLYGNKTEQTFASDATIDWFTNLIPSLPQGLDGAGLPLAAIIGQEVAAGVTLNDAIIGQILQGLAANPDTQDFVDEAQAALTSINLGTIGFGGALSPGFNIFDGTPIEPATAPISQIAISDNYEIGYKGLLGDKLSVSVDFYHIREDGNSQFTAISPAFALLGIDGLAGDLGSNAEGLFTPAFVSALQASGFTEEQANGIASQISPVVNGAYVAGGGQALDTPSDAFGGLTLSQLLQALPYHATIQTEQVPNNGVTHLAAGYRTFNERSYSGWDVGLEYFVNNNLSLFGNYSGVSETDFMQTLKGDDSGAEFATSLNIPKNKFRFGANYTPALGLRANLAYQHDESFNPIAGQFSGPTGARNLIDAGLGYKFKNGIQIDVTATNLLDYEYRYYQNMPLIGRRVVGKIRYDF